MASVRWRKVSLDEAKTHPLYGVKGFLALFAVVIALKALAFLMLLVEKTTLGALPLVPAVAYGCSVFCCCHEVLSRDGVERSR